MLIVTDLQGNTEPLIDYKTVQRKQRVNGEYSLSFPVFKTDNNIHSYPLVLEESIVEYEGQQYRIKKMDEKPIGLSAIKNVLADHIFFDLIDDYQYDLLSGYLSINEALTHALAPTNYTWEVLDAFPQYQFENLGDDNCLALVQTILDRYGAEIDIDNKHLIFRRKIGSKTDFQFRFKHNTKAITKSVDTSNLSTYIRGYGVNGIVAEYTSPMAAVYGIRHAKPVKDERFTTVESLTAHLQEVIQDEPKISFTIDFVDMRDQGYPYDHPRKGDEGFVIYEPLNIDITARILDIDELKDEKGNIIKTNVTLSNFRDNATDIMSSFSRTQKQVDGILEGKSKLPMTALDAAVQRATEVIKNAETEIEFPDSGWIVLRDNDNPNEVVVLNSKGLGISDNNLVDLLSAITGKGVVAERVYGNLGEFAYVRANQIKLGDNGETIPDSLLESAQYWNSIEQTLQSQIDGNITSWFYDYDPTIDNAPASEWTTDEMKNNHLGDLFYNSVSGYAWRFALENSVYKWVLLKDTDVTKALQDAAKAQDTADKKRRVFTATPAPPYDVGDLWSQGTAGELMRCKVAKTEGQTYATTDWEKAVKYTDDTTANSALNKANNSVQKGEKFDNSVVIGNGNGIKVKDASNNDRVVLGQYAAGLYGLLVNGGEIYSTTVRTNTKDGTTYIQLSSDNKITGVWNGAKTFEIQALGGGRLSLYDNGTYMGDFSLFDLNGRIGVSINSSGEFARLGTGGADVVANRDGTVDIYAPNGLYVNGVKRF
ncbi:Prophage endopeptidase tail [Schinkia azotoformans MEV2011]|uniref:Prophage endopeptidase tail n=1 Tax=Schinkia azotoformans MEV2011 TaxID=1348973 RepID=A0A072NSC9_SCHAZ|nr:phage tail protein [Schinkia azotoformans]KEF40107.1 Prophage endopeptidase tail [Schinkia azotoformans MEV2011]